LLKVPIERTWRFFAALVLSVATAVGATGGSPSLPTTTVAKPSTNLLALELLKSIPVALEHRGGYNRSLFPSSSDADGCDTRTAVLRRDSSTPIETDQTNCKVIAGHWTSPYDGRITTDPSAVEVDHVVSLKEAWDSGAWAWTSARRKAHANDLTDRRTLRTVSTSSNGSKGDRDPSNWLPTPADQCRFLGDWVAVKVRWGLSADKSEWGRIRNVLRARCPRLLIAVPLPLPSDALETTTGTADTSSATTGTANTSPATTTPPVTRSPSIAPLVPSTVYYKSCAEARAAGAAPLHRGDPGYRAGLDGDGDGTACED
jgi:hypothetical protein